MTPSHSKISQKLASVLPNLGSSSLKANEDEQNTPRMVSIRRTGSLEVVKQPHNWERSKTIETLPARETNRSDSTPSQKTGRTASKKKDKKFRKKLKKDKELDLIPAEEKMDTGVTVSTGSSMPTLHTVVSAVHHVSTAESHVITTPAKMEPTRSRPSDLKITPDLLAVTTGPVVSSDDVSQDAGEVQSMLREMMKPLDHSYSFITPIPTPNKAKQFVFPTQQVSGRHTRTRQLVHICSVI